MQRSIVGTGLGIACFTVEKKFGLIAVAEKVRHGTRVVAVFDTVTWNDFDTTSSATHLQLQLAQSIMATCEGA